MKDIIGTELTDGDIIQILNNEYDLETISRAYGAETGLKELRRLLDDGKVLHAIFYHATNEYEERGLKEKYTREIIS